MDKAILNRTKRQHYYELDKSFNLIFRSGRIVNIARIPLLTGIEDIGMTVPFFICKTNRVEVERIIN